MVTSPAGRQGANSLDNLGPIFYALGTPRGGDPNISIRTFPSQLFSDGQVYRVDILTNSPYGAITTLVCRLPFPEDFENTGMFLPLVPNSAGDLDQLSSPLPDNLFSDAPGTPFIVDPVHPTREGFHWGWDGVAVLNGRFFVAQINDAQFKSQSRGGINIFSCSLDPTSHIGNVVLPATNGDGSVNSDGLVYEGTLPFGSDAIGLAPSPTGDFLFVAAFGASGSFDPANGHVNVPGAAEPIGPGNNGLFRLDLTAEPSNRLTTYVGQLDGFFKDAGGGQHNFFSGDIAWEPNRGNLFANVFTDQDEIRMIPGDQGGTKNLLTMHADSASQTLVHQEVAFPSGSVPWGIAFDDGSASASGATANLFGTNIATSQIFRAPGIISAVPPLAFTMNEITTNEPLLSGLKRLAFSSMT